METVSEQDGGSAVRAQATPLGRNRNFILLLTGQFVSQMGDRLAMIAFPVLVLKTTGSTLSTGLVLAMYTLPYLVFAPWAGVIIDRFDRRRLMILSDVARALLVALVPLVASRSMPATFVLSFAVASFGVLFDPAKMSLLPDVVADDHLVRANSLLETTEKLTEILGYAAAGVLLSVLSTTAAFRIDALTFVLSAGALLLMKVQPWWRTKKREEGISFGHQFREGLAYLGRHKGLRTNTIVVIFSAIGVGAAYPLTFFLATNVFDKGAGGFAALEVAIAIGYLVGSVAVAWLGSRLNLGAGMFTGLVGMGLFLGLVALTGNLWSAALPFALFGLADAFAVIAIDTYVQQTVPEELRGRVWGVRLCLTQGASAAAIIVVGALASSVSVPALLVAAGLVIAVPAAVGAFIPAGRDIWRSARAREAREAAEI